MERERIVNEMIVVVAVVVMRFGKPDFPFFD